ncbi:MAG: hypothetical protein R3E01_19500 [Pirellulaceae bacterium]|nr:hypothetical protein [Planctomycetales bacterium]
MGGWIEANKAIADRIGIPLVAYEGGPHLLARTAQQQNDQGFIDLLADMKRDPRMRGMYEKLLGRWDAAGGETFVFFSDLENWGRSGSWGLKETLDDSTNHLFSIASLRGFADPTSWLATCK